ncbi:MAG: signal peptidase I [Phycisphaerae bacterium]|nr:signal peptidase I [Phycisphaerae bacterium]
MTTKMKKKPQKTVAQQFKETMESLIIAFVLAFVFRAFVVEAFVIPTGSMADTLRGAHFNLTCQDCGYEYNFGFIPRYYKMGENTIPKQPISPSPLVRNDNEICCPMCGAKIGNSPRHVSKGDRILVLKSAYQTQKPAIWDVVVFKNPTDPRENYIKRLIGLPNQKVEIRDGDVYIDDQIQRKPDTIQDTLWIEAFNNDYQLPDRQGIEGKWNQPFRQQRAENAWEIDQNARIFHFLGANETQSLTFNYNRMNYICNSFNAYNGTGVTINSICSDLKLQCIFTPTDLDSQLKITITKYGIDYEAVIDPTGKCYIAGPNGKIELTNLANGQTAKEGTFTELTVNNPTIVSFACVDHKFDFRIGEYRFEHIGANDPTQWGYQGNPKTPGLKLGGSGKPFTLTRIQLFRDIYYTNANISRNGHPGHGTEGNPIQLHDDEFFVMGDNSPQSSDARCWSAVADAHIEGKNYRIGTVPRDYLIGKAFYVYWPSGYRFSKEPFAIIPNASDMRFIK